MIIINFSHPLTNEIIRQIEEAAGRKVERVISVNSQIDPSQPLEAQVRKMVDQVGFSPKDWETLPFLVVLPGLSASAAVVVAEITGRCGFFPAVVRLRQVEGAVPVRFELAECINLQGVREQARKLRFSSAE